MKIRSTLALLAVATIPAVLGYRAAQPQVPPALDTDARSAWIPAVLESDSDRGKPRRRLEAIALLQAKPILGSLDVTGGRSARVTV